MAYVTNTDIEERLGTATYIQLTDDDNTGVADTDKVDEARLGAEGEVDSYLARRTAVPVDLVCCPELAAVLRSVVLDLVAYRLHGRRPPVADDIVRRRGEAIGWLERVADGRIALPAAHEPPANAATGLAAVATGAPRRATRETLRDL